jgi:HD-GYP domain-containing protein (c-di-GMP phosphodiesterase class II)
VVGWGQSLMSTSLIAEISIPRQTNAWQRAELGEGSDSIRTSELISALSYALDLTEGRTMGHSVRSCVIGMRLAQRIGMPLKDQADLYYTLLLKDAGCSSNSSRLFHILNADEIRAKRDVKTTDWTKVGFDSLQFAV